MLRRVKSVRRRHLLRYLGLVKCSEAGDTCRRECARHGMRCRGRHWHGIAMSFSLVRRINISQQSDTITITCYHKGQLHAASVDPPTDRPFRGWCLCTTFDLCRSMCWRTRLCSTDWQRFRCQPNPTVWDTSSPDLNRKSGNLARHSSALQDFNRGDPITYIYLIITRSSRNLFFTLYFKEVCFDRISAT